MKQIKSPSKSFSRFSFAASVDISFPLAFQMSAKKFFLAQKLRRKAFSRLLRNEKNQACQHPSHACNRHFLASSNASGTYQRRIVLSSWKDSIKCFYLPLNLFNSPSGVAVNIVFLIGASSNRSKCISQPLAALDNLGEALFFWAS